MSRGGMVSCEEVLTFLWAYLSAELPRERMEEFERHLARCPTCVSYIETYRETLALTRGDLEREAADELPEELVGAVLAAARKTGGS